MRDDRTTAAGTGRHAGAIALAAASLALCAGAGVALAGGFEFPSGFSTFAYKLTPSEAEFKGRVGSHANACVRKRKVTVYRESQGERTNIARAVTDGRGKFQIDLDAPAPRGKYFAHVKQRRVGEPGNDPKTCLERTSPPLRVGTD